MRKPLTQQQLVAVLDGWVDREVSVRVVSDSDELIAVFQGCLGTRSPRKQPSLFWPVRGPRESQHLEEPGIYLHPEEFSEAVAHEGEFVMELRQDGVTLNLRRL